LRRRLVETAAGLGAQREEDSEWRAAGWGD
jgi:hypothetical protein